jgi:hypothetical protein
MSGSGNAASVRNWHGADYPGVRALGPLTTRFCRLARPLRGATRRQPGREATVAVASAASCRHLPYRPRVRARVGNNAEVAAQAALPSPTSLGGIGASDRPPDDLLRPLAHRAFANAPVELARFLQLDRLPVCVLAHSQLQLVRDAVIADRRRGRSYEKSADPLQSRHAGMVGRAPAHAIPFNGSAESRAGQITFMSRLRLISRAARRKRRR